MTVKELAAILEAYSRILLNEVPKEKRK